MQMTKRDVADIVLVWILSSVLLSLVMSIATVAFYIDMARGPKEFTNQGIFFSLEALQVLVLLLLGYVLLFKRSAMLSFLFADGREKELAVPAGMEALASYAFWIRLFGVFQFLSHGVNFIGHLATSAAMQRQLLDSWSVRASVPGLVGVILAAAIVWKADWIAERLQALGTDRERTSADADKQ